MNLLLNIISKNNIVKKVARKVVKKEHLLTDPNLYFDCTKRKINKKVFLEDEYIENCKLISCREKLLEKMPQNGVYAEVGVAEGYFSSKIIEACNPKKLYMIEYGEDYCNELKKKFNKEIKDGIVEILQGDSVDMLKMLDDKSLDFVYLDATHDYEHPKAELNVCKNKVKDDGYIMGHDYTRFSMWEGEQYGVIEAVNEFMINNRYEMIYLTMDMLHSNASYALKKKTIKG